MILTTSYHSQAAFMCIGGGGGELIIYEFLEPQSKKLDYSETRFWNV